MYMHMHMHMSRMTFLAYSSRMVSEAHTTHESSAREISAHACGLPSLDNSAPQPSGAHRYTDMHMHMYMSMYM